MFQALGPRPLYIAPGGMRQTPPVSRDMRWKLLKLMNVSGPGAPDPTNLMNAEAFATSELSELMNVSAFGAPTPSNSMNVSAFVTSELLD